MRTWYLYPIQINDNWKHILKFLTIAL